MFASTSEPRTKTGCSTGSTFRYQHREPEKSLLHRIVREHLATFLAEAAERYPSAVEGKVCWDVRRGPFDR